MKLHIIHDAQGNIIAAAEVREGGLTPIAPAGHTHIQHDIPAEHEHLGLRELSRQLRVDMKSGRLVAKK